MKTAFQPLGVWRTFGCNSMGLVVGKGRHVLLSGQVAWDDQRHVVGVGDMRTQAQQTFRNIQASLAAVGGEMDDVVSIVTYVTTPDGLRDIHEVRTEFFSPPYPVSTLVQVAALVDPELLIEVTATAIVPEDRYQAPKAMTPDSFDVSDGGFNI
ncbi:MAG: RidA family protein [Acidiferrobacterales bacterium]